MKKKMPSTFIIAEIAQAHDGSLGILHSYIDALAHTGVDAVKFQVHIAEAESSADEPFRINFSYEDKTRYDYWQRMGFTLDQWREIKMHCDEKGVEFMASPFSQAAVDLLETVGVKRYKIGSGEVNNFLMLEKIAATGKPVILSSGMSSWEELDKAVRFLQDFDIDLTLLQCTTAYPTPPEKIGLNLLGEMKERYPGVRIGLSEHSARIATGIAAVALGAEILEFHAVFDRRMFGPDAASSLTIDEIGELVRSVRFIETSLNHPVDKSTNAEYRSLKGMFEKTLAVNKDLPAGHIIEFADLETKKPTNMGISAADFKMVIGRRLLQRKMKYEFLCKEDLQPDGEA
jgi:N-acetylneuraminate synthase